MKIKVYNRNGKVSVTKIANQRELVMFSELKDGEVAVIDVCVNQHTESFKEAEK